MSIRTGSQPLWLSALGCALEFAFPTVKLSEHTQSLDALLASDNPFAILTAAHWLNSPQQAQYGRAPGQQVALNQAVVS